jgi:hypothetical protein
MILVRWYCGNYAAPHDYGREAEECAAEFDTWEDEQDWKDEACSTICPSCGGGLTQKWDFPKLEAEVRGGVRHRWL